MPMRQIVLMMIRKIQIFISVWKDDDASFVKDLLQEVHVIIKDKKEFPTVAVYDKKVLNFILEEQKKRKPSRWIEKQDLFKWYRKMDKA